MGPLKQGMKFPDGKLATTKKTTPKATCGKRFHVKMAEANVEIMKIQPKTNETIEAERNHV